MTTLPRPHYTKIGLDTYLDAIPLPLPLPPGKPESWTCALSLFGTLPLVAKDDRGYTDLLDKDLLREILSGFGRPTRKEEQLALLLTTPIPGDADVASVLGGLLKHRTYWVRQRTAVLIGLMGLTGAQKALIANLGDSDNDARRGAAEGLGRLRDAGAVETLARGPWEDSDSSVDHARCTALARINDWDRTAAAASGLGADGEGFELLTAMIDAHKSGDGSELLERMESGDDDVKRAIGHFFIGHPAMSANHAASLGEVMG
ncbi:MAG: HEAT repeat domain-containing protein, partial [Proteobacteria bacterium]|nr:HEAT repeat domain-containing protein [Pseudomonadota bacterium]